jgi:DNA adenine methylase
LKSPLKWTGSKRQLLPEIRKYYPKNFNTYYEPFLGSAAVLFDLQPKNAWVNDLNWELINLYSVIKNNLDELIHELETQCCIDTKERYYQIRKWDRSLQWPKYFQSWEIAARTIYLNKTGFNGLYRLNKQGKFNVPYGKHETPFKPNIENLKEVSKYLNDNNIIMTFHDFELAVKDAEKEDFVYFDSPYYPISETSNFTSYTKDGFNKEDQIRLKNCFEELSNRGCYCLLSNSYCDFIKDLYKDFEIIEVKATRMINSKGNGRGKISEVLIKNY